MTPRSPLMAAVAAAAALALAGNASADTGTFQSAGQIKPADRVDTNHPPGVDPAAYPSTLGVAGLKGSITHVRLTLNDVSSTFAGDLDVMLVAPDGHSVIALSDVGGAHPLDHATIALDDNAPAALPESATIASGAYRPTNLGADADEFPSFPEPSGKALSRFNGHDPNGNWRLLVTDDQSRDTSTIAGGWELAITTTGGTVVARQASFHADDRQSNLGAPSVASLYPNEIQVAGASGAIDHVTVSLHSMITDAAQDADVMLQAPSGRCVVLLSDGFGTSMIGTVTLDDRARIGVPETGGQHQTTYIPTDIASGRGEEPSGDVFPAPAPQPGSTGPGAVCGTSLDGLRGSSPNGKWRLFLTDDFHDGQGITVAGGWSLNITTKAVPKPAPKPQPQPAKPLLTSLSLKAKKFTARKGTTVRYGLSASAQVRFRVQRRTATGRFKTLRGSLKRTGVAGPNAFRFRAKVGGKRLKPGSYRLKATVAGGSSRKVRFRIVKPAAA